MSPTARSLDWLRKNGYTAQVVEKWNAFAKIRIDLFGIIDIVAIKDGEPGVLGIQSTSADNISSRLEKCLASPVLQLWRKTGNRMRIHGWGKRGAKGERKLWTLITRDL